MIPYKQSKIKAICVEKIDTYGFFLYNLDVF